MFDIVKDNSETPDSFPTRLDNVLQYCSSDRIRPPRYSDKVRLANLKASKKHATLYPGRFGARNKARFNINSQPCEVCGLVGRIQRHHHNYAKPLDVIQFCKKHHKEIHSWDSIGYYNSTA